MKIRFLKSISAKLFYYTAILVSAVIFAVSYQNSKSYQQMLLRTFQDASLDRGENIRITLENFFSSLDSQLKITLATMLSVNKVQRETTAFNFLENNKRNFVAIQVFRQAKGKKATPTLFQFTSEINNPALESKDPKKVADKIRRWNRVWLNRSIKKAPEEEVFLSSFASKIKLPIISYAKSYENGRTGETYWAVLSLWQEPFFSLLDGTNDSEIIIVETNGRIFSSKDINSLKKGVTLKRTKLFKKASADTQGLGSAFIGSYKGRKGIRWLGSYQKIDSLGLIVFMEKNEDALSRDIDALVIRTAKWGLLFVLIALAFSAVGSTTITHNLKNVANITQAIAKGDFSSRITPSSNDEIGYLALSVNSMADRIGHLLTEKVEKARFEKELETANAVQNTLFPKKGLENDVMHVEGFSKPASECGGDWWGYFVQPDGKTFILIADAMGHGVPAALVTAMAYANCMSLQAIAQDSHLENELTPKNFLERFNKVLFDAVEGSITMSFFALLVDTEAATLTFANAGHNFPVLLPKDPDDPRISRKSKKLQKISPITPISLKASGSILGIDRTATFDETTMPIAAGDKIFLFTDGLIECTSEQGKVWGRKGLINQLLAYCDRGALGLRDSIHHEAYTFFGNQPPIDDVTMVVAEIKQVNTSARVPAAEEAKAPAQAVEQTAAQTPVQAPAAAPAQEPVAAAPIAESAPPPMLEQEQPEESVQPAQVEEQEVNPLPFVLQAVPKAENQAFSDADEMPSDPGVKEIPSFADEMPIVHEPDTIEPLFEDTSESPELVAEQLADISEEPMSEAQTINLSEVPLSLNEIDLDSDELEAIPPLSQPDGMAVQPQVGYAVATEELDQQGEDSPFGDQSFEQPQQELHSDLLVAQEAAQVASQDSEDKVIVSADNYLNTVDDPNKVFDADIHVEKAKSYSNTRNSMLGERQGRPKDDTEVAGEQELMTHVGDMVDEQAGETVKLSAAELAGAAESVEAVAAESADADDSFAANDDKSTSISISAMLGDASEHHSDDDAADDEESDEPNLAS